MENVVIEIQKAAASYFKMPVDLMKDKCRKREYVVFRAMAIYYLLTEIKLKESKICGYFNRDRTTMIDCKDTFATDLSRDKILSRKYQEFKNYCSSITTTLQS